MRKPKEFFQYLKTHKFTVILRLSLFFLCLSLTFTILFGLLERDGVFEESTATPQPTATPTPEPTAVDRGTNKYIAVNMGQEPLNLNSITAEDAVTKTILQHMLEGLVRLDAQGLPVPAVATLWSPSEDYLTWTFTLREDSFWQDGTRVVSGDFKNAIELHLDPASKSPYRAQMTAFFAGIETPDDNTIIFTLKNADPNFPAMLAQTQFMPIQRALYDQAPASYGVDPKTISYNGPWYVVLWTHNQRIVMIKNETYWNKDAVALEQLIFISSGNASSKLSNFKAGNYDMVFVSSGEAKAYRESGYSVVNYPDGHIIALEFNKKDSLLQYESLRKALSLAIDRTSFVKDTLKTGATAIEGYDISVDLPLAKEALEAFQTEWDTANAEAEQKAPSLKDGLIITVDDSEESVLYATALAQQWKKALGIQVTVEYLSYAERIEKIQKGTMQISITISDKDASLLEAPLYYRHSLYATNGRIKNIISSTDRALDLYYATP